MSVKGIAVETLSTDPDLLIALAREVIETVEIRIEDIIPRLVLAFESSTITDISDSGEQHILASNEEVAAIDIYEEQSYKGIDVQYIVYFFV